jgi:hypothetical protein
VGLVAGADPAELGAELAAGLALLVAPVVAPLALLATEATLSDVLALVPTYTKTKLKAIINIGRTKIPQAAALAPFIDKYNIAKTEISPKNACIGILPDSFIMASCIIIAVNNAAVAIAG